MFCYWVEPVTRDQTSLANIVDAQSMMKYQRKNVICMKSTVHVFSGESNSLEPHPQAKGLNFTLIIRRPVNMNLTDSGAVTGAITGAVAGKASDCGVLRGAGFGAIAGAVLSVEVLEASRAYWCLEQSGSRGPSSMANFIEELLRGRLIEEQLTPAMLTAQQWQVRVAELDYDELDRVTSKGLSVDLLKKLPHHVMVDDMKTTAQRICCTICLQDIRAGEVARSLPKCCHTFHLVCVDKWLIRHGSCPICRQGV